MEANKTSMGDSQGLRIAAIARQISLALLVALAAQPISRLSRMAGAVVWCLALFFIGLRFRALAMATSAGVAAAA